MSRKRKTAFLALMAIWFSVIASFCAYKEIILRFGHSVMLEVMPFDPRDLFRGDYVNLRYDINVADKDRKILDYRGGVSSYNITGGETVYVMLVKDGKFYKGGDIRLKKPVKGLFIKGKAETAPHPEFDDGREFFISYGIENYFVPEGRGAEIGRAAMNGKLSARIRLGPDGDAVIEAVYINGKKADFKNKNEKND